MSPLAARIQEDVKAAMKAKDKARLAVLRLITAALKQKEVDDRTELNDDQVIAVLEKMVKQRKDSIAQYEKAGRTELAEQEAFEIDIIRQYLPEPLSDAEIDALIDEAIAATGASSMKEMGKAMGWLKPKLAGRADMGQVSARLKQRLG